MSNRRILLAIALGMIVLVPAAQAQSNEFELDAGYYFTSEPEFGPNDTRLKLSDEFTYGLRYGHRFNEMFGIGISWSHLEADKARPHDALLHCQNCDAVLDFADFSFEWYPGGGDFTLYGGGGWVTSDFTINIDGDDNDLSFTDDTFTFHVGAAYTAMLGDSFYIRPDVRVRFLQLDDGSKGNYDTEDPEVRLGFGWRF